MRELVGENTQWGIRLHWTKCPGLTKHGSDPKVQQKLLRDEVEELYSSMIDEITDVGMYKKKKKKKKKGLAVAVRDCSQGQQCPLLPGLPAEMLEIFNSGSVADVAARKTELRNTKQRTGLATNSFIIVCGKKKPKKTPTHFLQDFEIQSSHDTHSFLQPIVQEANREVQPSVHPSFITAFSCTQWGGDGCQ